MAALAIQKQNTNSFQQIAIKILDGLVFGMATVLKF
jgi:hypothetical protein